MSVLSPKSTKKIGLFLKEKREDARLTQEGVALSLGYTSAQFISNVERGLCLVPKNKMKKLLKLYEVSPYSWMRLYLICVERDIRDQLSLPKK